MKTFPTSRSLLMAALMLATLILGAFNADAGSAAPVSAAYATIITVNSSADLSSSDSNTCISHTPCTLRRAVIQARSATKPVLIQFNIPTTDSGYDAALHIWRIEFLYYSSTANATLRYLNGQITIDGSTQPGGRTNGPRIILVGPAAERDGIKLGETYTQNANQIIGLGFQNFKTHIYVNSSSNLIEDNWFGLSDDGTNIALRVGGEDDGSGNTGVSVMTGANTNIIQNNVFAGLAGVAASIIGDDNTFANNYIGTRADGTVPDLFPGLTCSQWDWLGGSGISMDGQGNLVENNIFAGIRIAVEAPTIQADTIRVGNDDHIIRNNKIGVDSANSEVGVCGRGILLQGGTEFNQVTSNTIVNPGYSAISLNDTPVVSTSDANTLRRNIIKKNTPWGEIEGNDNPEDAIQMTKSLPDAFLNFNPAKITSVNGVTVTGTNGVNSPCPNCIIEIFLDDTDAVTEALQPLAVVNANASGNWSATLPAALTESQGLRTTSTTTIHNTIAGMSAGTTTGLSDLFLSVHKVYLPLAIKP